jgi:hypothetical protein
LFLLKASVHGLTKDLGNESGFAWLQCPGIKTEAVPLQPPYQGWLGPQQKVPQLFKPDLGNGLQADQLCGQIELRACPAAHS